MIRAGNYGSLTSERTIALLSWISDPDISRNPPRYSAVIFFFLRWKNTLKGINVDGNYFDVAVQAGSDCVTSRVLFALDCGEGCEFATDRRCFALTTRLLLRSLSRCLLKRANAALLIITTAAFESADSRVSLEQPEDRVLF